MSVFVLPTVLISCLMVIGCCSSQLDVGLSGLSGAGFFMRPFYPWHNDSSIQEWPLLGLAGLQYVTATYGPFAAQADTASVPPYSTLGNQSTQVIDGFIVSAHIASDRITYIRPQVVVVFHVGRQLLYADGGSDPSTYYHSKIERSSSSKNQQLCITAYVQKGSEEVAVNCVLDDTSAGETCVANLTLPYFWWDTTRSRLVDVSYSAVIVRNGRRCPAAVVGNQKGDVNFGSDGLFARKVLVSQVNLAVDTVAYEEIREDQHVLIYLPVANFSQGSLFKVPVRLQAESKLQAFVMRVKCRNGIRVLGTETPEKSVWHTTSDISNRQHVAVVTANNNNTSSTKTFKSEDIFRWIFEVSDEATEDMRGRLQFSLEYELTNNRRDVYAPIQNRATALVPLRSVNTYTIIPVVKMTEIVNIAVFTGQVQSWPLKVYLLNQLGRVTDVTHRSTCQSQNTRALQVSVTCDMVYFDGTETVGASSVGIVVKYGQLTRTLFLRVWIPELPLDIEMTDSKLSQITDWRIPSNTGAASPPASKPEGDHEAVTDKAKDDGVSACRSQRFQSTIVDVYTRFMLSDVLPVQYLLHRKAMFRVTNLVKHQLRVADISVAKLRSGNVMDGLKVGRTEIQVMLRSGRVIGAREVKVSSDRVKIDRLDVEMVSGLAVSVNNKADFPGALAVHVAKTKAMQHRYQESVLEMVLKFDDGTSFPLSLVPDADFSVTAETLNNQVVALAPPHLARAISIMAVSPGSGDLVRVSLNVSGVCQAMKSRLLATGLAHVEVDFDEFAQNDASYYKADIDQFDGGRRHEVKTIKGILHTPSDRGGHSDERNGRGGPGRRRGNKGKFGNVELSTTKQTDPTVFGEDTLPKIEAQKQMQPVVEVHRGTAPLEMAMYILLAVFAASVIIFAANCMVFVTRHRRKRKFTETKETVSEVRDWVWIGRATLERNAVDLTCPKRLMSDADFNSNLSRARPVSSTLLLPCSSGNNSNRNSTVSTYHGSECSVRITANPLVASDDNGNVVDDAADSSYMLYDSGNTPATPEQVLDDASPTEGGEEAYENPNRRRGCGPGTLAWSTMSREEQLRELEEVCANGGLDSTWNYEEFGMTYNELMKYFDNLKESSA